MHVRLQAAPSYDTLCAQIRDVQRQYTCGTGRERAGLTGELPEPGRPPRVAPALANYISGLDGPALDEVAGMQGLPMGLVGGWGGGRRRALVCGGGCLGAHARVCVEGRVCVVWVRV